MRGNADQHDDHAMDSVVIGIADMESNNTSNAKLNLTIAIDVVNFFTIPLILTDNRGHLIISNKTADHALAKGSGPSVKRNLVSWPQLSQPRLWSQAIARCTVAEPSALSLFDDFLPNGPLIAIKPVTFDTKRYALVAWFMPEPITNTKLASPFHSHNLTPREVQVAALLAYGLTAEQIAEKLSIKTNTARTHIKHIYIKLGVNNHLMLSNLFRPFSIFG